MGLVFSLPEAALAQGFGGASSSGMSSSRSGSIGLGFLNYNSGIAATSASSGSKPFSSELYTQLSVSGMFSVYDQWSLSPVLVYGFPSKKTPEGKETTTVSALGVRAYRLIDGGFDFHIGPGVMYYQVKGSGGTVTLNNGSSTSNFGIPSGTRTSTLLYMDFGAGYSFWGNYKVEASILMTGLTASNKRAMTHLITFSMEVL